MAFKLKGPRTVLVVLDSQHPQVPRLSRRLDVMLFGVEIKESLGRLQQYQQWARGKSEMERKPLCVIEPHDRWDMY